MEMLPEYRSEEKGAVKPASPSSSVASPGTSDSRAGFRKLWKRVLVFLFRWANALLFLFQTYVFIRETSSVERVLMLRCVPPSLLMVASFAAFRAAGKLDSVVRRSFALWANVVALAAHFFWVFLNWRNGEFDSVTMEAMPVALLTLGFFLLVTACNVGFFWYAWKMNKTPGDLAAAVPDETGNVLARHWRGELRLSISFWVCSWLSGLMVYAIRQVLDTGMVVRDPKTAAILYVVLYGVATMLGVWVFVGIWRSATRHVVSGKLAVWGSLAKLTLVLFLLNQIGMVIWVYPPKVREHFDFISGHELVEPYQIMSSRGGEVVEFSGGLRYGSASALETTLARCPNAKVLKLNSPGGRISEGLKMITLVRERNLDTYAFQRCMSSATLVLAAGNARGAEERTLIGFHSSRNPAAGSTVADEWVMGSMLAAGISEDFVQRVMSTPPDRMWFPSPEEMLNGHVLTSYGTFPPTGATNAPPEKPN